MSNNVNFNAVKASPNGFVTGASYNTLVDLVRSLVITDSPDYRVNRNLGGTTLNVNFPPSPSPVTPLPFQEIGLIPVGGDMTGDWVLAHAPARLDQLGHISPSQWHLYVATSGDDGGKCDHL